MCVCALCICDILSSNSLFNKLATNVTAGKFETIILFRVHLKSFSVFWYVLILTSAELHRQVARRTFKPLPLLFIRMGVTKLCFSSALESFCYDSPDRQTLVMEGWFVAGDFLQGNKETIQHLQKPEVLMCNNSFHCFSIVCLSFSQCCHRISMRQERLQQSEVTTPQKFYFPVFAYFSH